MELIVRIGKIADQDSWRRQDVQRLSADERVRMLLEMQDRMFAATSQPLLTKIALRPHPCKSPQTSAS